VRFPLHPPHPPPLADQLRSRTCSRRLADHHQLSLTLEILGTPSLDDFYAISSTRSRDYIRALPFRKRRNFAQMFPNANPLAVDLMVRSQTACRSEEDRS
jgi:hypothetical protein